MFLMRMGSRFSSPALIGNVRRVNSRGNSWTVRVSSTAATKK